MRSKPFMSDYLPTEHDPNATPAVPHYREERHEEHNDGANGYDEGSVAAALFGQRHFGGNDPQDPEHDPIGDAPTEYDIEFDDDDPEDDDDDPEDDGQPSEYEEWQDYMGGDDWDQGQYDW